jgi:hypothetical protein
MGVVWKADSFGLAGTMKAARTHHTATLMPNGRVLLAGGRDESMCLPLVETFDPDSDGFRVSGYMIAPRQEHTATLLLDGLLLLTGGLGGTPFATDAEVCLI